MQLTDKMFFLFFISLMAFISAAICPEAKLDSTKGRPTNNPLHILIPLPAEEGTPLYNPFGITIDKTKIVIEKVVIFLCASQQTIKDVMDIAKEIGMTKGDYVFIYLQIPIRNSQDHIIEDDGAIIDGKNDGGYDAVRIMMIRLRAPNNAIERNTSHAITSLGDALLLYAIAVNESLMSAGESPKNARSIVGRMWNRTFIGLNGNAVEIDANGDRVSDISILQYKHSEHIFQEVAYYESNSNELIPFGNFNYKNRESVQGETLVCGYDNSLCPSKYPAWLLIIGTAILIAILLILLVVVILYSRITRKRTSGRTMAKREQQTPIFTKEKIVNGVDEEEMLPKSSQSDGTAGFQVQRSKAVIEE